MTRTTIAAIWVWGLATVAGAAIPRPEHPRPDFQRTAWQSLNGEWQFAIDEEGDGEQQGWSTGRDLPLRIVVPFCPESRLSGLGLATNYLPHVWYRRTFEIPADLRAGRLFLRFGAVDYRARVWLNGRFLGEHVGGYTPFAFEVTRCVREGVNEVVVHAVDELRSGLQPGGKQSHGKSEGCVYTRTTGIWQPVWLEAAGETHVRDVTLAPDLPGGRVLVQAEMDGPSKDVTLRVRASADGQVVGEDTVAAGWRSTLAVVKLSRVVPWEPGKPFLYDLTLETLKGGEVIDTVRSYVGLRRIAIEGNRFLINGRPVFQRLILDQGFYPEGICTAPTDDDLRRDIELSMEAGFNGARLHQKVFEPRTLYWADKLGYLVWGEFPSWGINLEHPEAVARFVDEWHAVMRRDRNHPSIVGWCPLNETGTQEAIARIETLLKTTMTMDPTRPFLDSSGYTHFLPETDVYDAHDYDGNPVSFAARYEVFSQTGGDPFNNHPGDPRSAYRGQPYFVSEYGGIRVKTDRDGDAAGWGYGGQSLGVEEFFARYKGLTDAQLDNPNIFAFCYTQLTDVEQEQNGVYFYDRKPKYDVGRMREINARPAACETQPPRVRKIEWSTLVPSSEKEPQTWRYTTNAPAADWSAREFNDAAWSEGPAGFGSPGTVGAKVGTEWRTEEIWIRRHFRAGKISGAVTALRVQYDEDAEVYVNGTKVADLPGFIPEYRTLINAELGQALAEGDNVIAIHCRNAAGGQSIDAGLEIGREAME